MSYGTTGSLFRSGSRTTFFATQVTRSSLESLQIIDWNEPSKPLLSIPLMFLSQICRYLCCFSPQHALLPHVLHVQRWELPQSVYKDVKLAAPAMLLPHESTVSHETQQEKGALTARQSTATQELTNGGSKVWVKVSIDFNLAYAIIILIHSQWLLTIPKGS